MHDGKDHFDVMSISFSELHADAVFAIMDHLPNNSLIRLASTCRYISDLAQPTIKDRYMKHKWTGLDCGFDEPPLYMLVRLLRDPAITKYARLMELCCIDDDTGYLSPKAPKIPQDIEMYRERISEEISKLGVFSKEANAAWTDAVVRGEYVPSSHLILAMCRNLNAILVCDLSIEYIKILGSLMATTPNLSTTYADPQHQSRSILSIRTLELLSESDMEPPVVPLLQNTVNGILLAPSLRTLEITAWYQQTSLHYYRSAEDFEWPSDNKSACTIQHLNLRGFYITHMAIRELIEGMPDLKELDYDQYQYNFLWYTRFRYTRSNPGHNNPDPEAAQALADGPDYVSTYPDDLLEISRAVLKERGLHIRKCIPDNRGHSEAFHIHIAQTRKSDGKLRCEKWPISWVYVGP